MYIHSLPRQAVSSAPAAGGTAFALPLLPSGNPKGGEGVTKATPRFDEQADAADGAVAGAVAGASAGAVAGAIATMLIPGLGIILGGSILAGIVGGAALGAAGGSFLGPFIALEMPHDEAHHYARQIEEGRTVVLVRTHDRAAEARAILRNHGAADRYSFREAAASL